MNKVSVYQSRQCPKKSRKLSHRLIILRKELIPGREELRQAGSRQRLGQAEELWPVLKQKNQSSTAQSWSNLAFLFCCVWVSKSFIILWSFNLIPSLLLHPPPLCDITLHHRSSGHRYANNVQLKISSKTINSTTNPFGLILYSPKAVFSHLRNGTLPPLHRSDTPRPDNCTSTLYLHMASPEQRLGSRSVYVAALVWDISRS